MYYITGKSYTSKTFYSFSHTQSDIINAICEKRMHILKLMEYDYDLSGMFENLNKGGIPLSYILISQKYQ